MADPAGLALALILGAALGALHGWGLWATVRALRRVRAPGLLLAASMALRTAITVAGFYLVMQGSATRLLVCLAGFIAARTLLTRRLGAAPPAPPPGGRP